MNWLVVKTSDLPYILKLALAAKVSAGDTIS